MAPESKPDSTQGQEPDEVRRRFKEALERKQGKGGAAGGGHGPDAADNKPPASTGPAKAQRTFRRKSG